MSTVVTPFYKKIIFKLCRIFSKKNAHDLMIKDISKRYDMFKLEDEEFFAKIYLKYILETSLFKDPGRLRILDAGCGQGRIALPLADKGHNVDAVDFTGDAILKCKEYIQGKQVKINFFNQDLTQFLKKSEKEIYDCVICTEVTYMLHNYDEVLKELVRVLKKGGVLVLSVRPKLFYVLHQVMNKQFEKALFTAANDNGHSINWFFNWHTHQGLIEKLSSLGLEQIKCYGIGVCSGIEGDPQGLFARPSMMSDSEKEKLYEIEFKMGPLYQDFARYILAIGVKGGY